MWSKGRPNTNRNRLLRYGQIWSPQCDRCQLELIKEIQFSLKKMNRGFVAWMGKFYRIKSTLNYTVIYNLIKQYLHVYNIYLILRNTLHKRHVTFNPKRCAILFLPPKPPQTPPELHSLNLKPSSACCIALPSQHSTTSHHLLAYQLPLPPPLRPFFKPSTVTILTEKIIRVVLCK